METNKLLQLHTKVQSRVVEAMTKGFEDLTNEEIYKQHANLLHHCGMARMAKEFKEFVVDDENREVLRLL